jgi:hypothetical protein
MPGATFSGLAATTHLISAFHPILARRIFDREADMGPGAPAR